MEWRCGGFSRSSRLILVELSRSVRGKWRRKRLVWNHQLAYKQLRVFEYPAKGYTWYQTPPSHATYIHSNCTPPPHIFTLVSSSPPNMAFHCLLSRVCNDLGPSTTMPNSKQSSTVSALMLDVLEPSREVGDAATAETEAAEKRNHAVSLISSCDPIICNQRENLLCGATRNKLNSRHLPDSTHWAVDWRGPLLQ